MPYVPARLPGVITSEPTIEPRTGRGPTRGWCPGVLDPMETGDGWLLRIRVPGGFVTAVSVTAVAAISAEFGSGIVDITSRGNLQVRGVPGDRVDEAITAVVAAGLASSDARRDAFRAVVSNPLTGHDPDAVYDATSLVDALVSRLVGGVVGTAPSKFGIVIDDGGSWPLDGIDADVAFQICPDGTWAVRLRGVADAIGRTVHPVDVAETATQLCVDQASRMSEVVALLGVQDVSVRLGVNTAASDVAALRRPAVAERIIGVLPHTQAARANVVAAPFLGRTDTATLTAVAALTSVHGAALRLTPDHSFAFCGIRVETAAGVQAELRDLGLVVDRDDPRAEISACVGSRGCGWAQTDTWTAGHELATSARPRGRVHLSACAKECGAPAHARRLVADATGTFR